MRKSKNTSWEDIIKASVSGNPKPKKKNYHMTNEKLLSLGYEVVQGKRNIYYDPQNLGHKIKLLNGKIHIEMDVNSKLSISEIMKKIDGGLPEE